MACQWRIRHKLMLGLALVVGLVALLMGGSLKGLASYRATVNMFDSKLLELHALQELKASLLLITDLRAGMTKDEVKQKVNQSREKLNLLHKQLEETINRQRDPNNAEEETRLVEAMEEWLGKLDLAIDNLNTGEMNHAIAELHRAVEQYNGATYKDLYNRITIAKTDFKTSTVVVLAISVLGILLMTGLLRFFYRWTFYPLRDLQAGVGRVAQGDFEHGIEVHSGDEMEELAAAFNDMTRRLREIYSDLARQVNERSRQLVRSERLAGVGFLAAGVAHEINNPLASIAFCSEALEARLREIFASRFSSADFKPGPSDSQSKIGEQKSTIEKYLKMIQEEAFRCKAITQKLLEFSRGGEKRREPTDLVELVQSVLDMVQHLPSSKGKNIEFAGVESALPLWGVAGIGVQPGGRLVAWVNAQEIRSVILNLVVNALDSMDEGGTVAITLKQRDGMAELIFADTGCGMTPEVLENIFEPFFTRSRTGKGTGLGLSISHRIINQHGGEIEATSPGVNAGSTFSVRIPLQPAEALAEETLARLAA